MSAETHVPLVVSRKRGTAPPALSPEKSRELLGILLVAVALFLGLALGTYHPEDPSFFHRTISDASRTRNAAGPVGAEIAALAFQFLGASCLAVPLFLLVGGWRRLRRRNGEKVVGRGIGALLLLAALPALLQVLVVEIPWRQGTVAAGGAFGVVLSELLLARLNLPGTLLVLLVALLAGALLAVQSTLDDMLRAWRARLAHGWQEWQLARARRKERKEKEKSRRRVVAKHLQRAAEEKQRKEEPAPTPVIARGLSPAPVGGRIDLPLRRAHAAAPEELDELDLVPERPRAAAGPRGAAAERGVLARATRGPRQEALFSAPPAGPGALPPINLLSLEEPRSGVDESELVRLGEVIRSR
ncbi:MAG TPA: DNA translocase FtsK 4TM domain-containing protein, partial [Thermoanaerobaculia bacterium]